MSTQPGELLTSEAAAFFLTRDAWRNWTPTVVQGGAVAKTVNYARYVTIGNTVHIIAKVTFTAAGTGGNVIQISGVPAAIGIANAANDGADIVGTFAYLDSGTAFYFGYVYATSATTLAFLVHNASSGLGLTPAFTIAIGDKLGIKMTYERA